MGYYRIAQGGSWFFDSHNARFDIRSRDDPADRFYDLGLRLVRRST